jgi:hypothetical protein
LAQVEPEPEPYFFTIAVSIATIWRRIARRTPPSVASAPSDYAEWLADVKARIHAAQQRATLVVNRELLTLYWQLGRDILERQVSAAWGDGILDQVSADLFILGQRWQRWCVQFRAVVRQTSCASRRS